jgi:hypothetical protein
LEVVRLASREDLVTDEDRAKFLKEFGSRVNALVDRLQKATGLNEGPISLGDLDILAAALMELLGFALANMPEPMCRERLNGFPTILEGDVAQKRRRIGQMIPKGSG